MLEIYNEQVSILTIFFLTLFEFMASFSHNVLKVFEHIGLFTSCLICHVYRTFLGIENILSLYRSEIC